MGQAVILYRYIGLFVRLNSIDKMNDIIVVWPKKLAQTGKNCVEMKNYEKLRGGYLQFSVFLPII